MGINIVDSPIKVLRFFMLGCCLLAPLAALAESDKTPAGSEETPLLTEENLASLQSALAEMQQLAPQLRILLRSLRKQVGFDSREIFNIERGISQSQQNMERLIAMQERGAMKPMRAHFIADDLRRKADGMRDSLAYVVRRSGELEAASGDKMSAEVLKENADLREHLTRYSALLDQSVKMLKERQL